MTDLFSGFKLGATSLSRDPCTVIDIFFSHWVVGQHGDGFGILAQATCWTQEKVKTCKRVGTNLEISKATKGPRPSIYLTGHDSLKRNLTKNARGYPTSRGNIRK